MDAGASNMTVLLVSHFSIVIANSRFATTVLLGITFGIPSWCCFLQSSSCSLCGISTANNPLETSMMLTPPLSRPLPTPGHLSPLSVVCLSIVHMLCFSQGRKLNWDGVWHDRVAVAGICCFADAEDVNINDDGGRLTWWSYIHLRVLLVAWVAPVCRSVRRDCHCHCVFAFWLHLEGRTSWWQRCW